MVYMCRQKGKLKNRENDIGNMEVKRICQWCKKEGTGKVIIKRDSGFMGSACMTRIYIDGKEIADLDTAEKAVIYPVIGTHIFSAWPKGMCGGGMSEQSGEVTEGKTLMYRVGYGTNGDFGIYLQLLIFYGKSRRRGRFFKRKHERSHDAY